jgi:hypothetical protein
MGGGPEYPDGDQPAPVITSSSTETKESPYEIVKNPFPPLPRGWMMGTLPNGHTWFWNEMRRPQRLDPRTPQGQIVLAHEAKFTEPLPKGWEPGVTEEGVIYYSDHKARRNSFTRPSGFGSQNGVGNSGSSE